MKHFQRTFRLFQEGVMIVRKKKIKKNFDYLHFFNVLFVFRLINSVSNEINQENNTKE
jgi:hypothetical protein